MRQVLVFKGFIVIIGAILSPLRQSWPILYPKFINDDAVPEIRIGVKEFNCIGVSPPGDHPHVYLNMGEIDTILCPYCSTLFRFDPRLGPLESAPGGCLFSVGDEG